MGRKSADTNLLLLSITIVLWLLPPAVSAQKQMKLHEALKQLHHEKGTFFLFAQQAFGNLSIKPCYANFANVEAQLNCLLSQTNLTFKKINATTFVIVEEEAELASSAKSSAANSSFIVKGLVVNAMGEPVANASIVVGKGASGTGTTTNNSGKFQFSVDQPGMLQISSVGYKQKEWYVNSSRDVLITLEPIEKEMEEVIVTSLGLQREKRSLGYAVSSIHSHQINAVANTNIASALYGKVPGVRISAAPGGATSAVYVQIRGLNSLNFNAQPLYVLDGAVIRNLNEKGVQGINNNGFWDDQRIRGNGLLDINPLDVESITVLKGASATALYGSEAATGVIVITTKKGSPKKGLGLQINYSVTAEKAAFLPRFQNEYGPGLDRVSNLAAGATEEGWVPVDGNNDGLYDGVRPNFTAWAQFGPKFDGRIVPWWNGENRAYTAQPNNFREFFRTGISSLLSVSFGDRTEKAAYRVAFTRNDYKGAQVGGKLERNTFFLNTQYQLLPKLKADWMFTWVNSEVVNRPLQLNRVIATYTGLINRAENTSLLFDRYQNSDGYKWVPWNLAIRNPQEALRYPVNDEAMNFLWMQLRNRETESQNRMFSVATLSYEAHKNLKFRGRVGYDFTSLQIETKNFNEYPTRYNTTSSTGQYGISNGRYSLVYGDLLATYNKSLTESWQLTVNAGMQAREERYVDQMASTTNGLAKDNWFNLSNSFGPVFNEVDRTHSLQYAYLAFSTLSYRKKAFIELTARKEYTSTLPPGRNSYFYPSINASWLVHKSLKLPAWIDYFKLRSSYGLVGNAPPPYTAAITYRQGLINTVRGPVATQITQNRYGNNDIRPEHKRELEAGAEFGLFKNRLGMSFTFYSNTTEDQILQLTVPSSMGAASRLVNSGQLTSTGIEWAVDVNPILTRNFNWTSALNVGYVHTRTKKLAAGVSAITYLDMEQGAIRIMAEEGKRIGNIYVYPKKTNETGQPVVGDNGLYIIDQTSYKKAGNVMPDLIGGWQNAFRFKQFNLEFLIDYRIGGQYVSPVVKYNTGAGMYESTLRYRSEKHGGLPYYIDGAGTKIALASHNQIAPDGAKVYHDGLILNGVGLDGKPNTKIVDAAYYYTNMFYWGPNALNEEGAVFDNSYAKLRELSFSYALPAERVKKLGVQSVRFSLIGRNLFYVWRTLKNLDPESSIGTSWSRQGIDDASTAASRSMGCMIQIGF